MVMGSHDGTLLWILVVGLIKRWAAVGSAITVFFEFRIFTYFDSHALQQSVAVVIWVLE